jgi:preprotein translocase subunit SecD
MRTLTFMALFVCGLFVTSCDPQQGRGPAVFQVRLVQDRATSDTEQMTILRSLTDVTNATPETLDVQKKVLLDHTAISSATVRPQNPPSPPVIEVVFTEQGRKLFAEITRQSVGKRLAIVVEGKLLAAPQIEMEIPGGRALITGRFTAEQASEFAAAINSGVRK